MLFQPYDDVGGSNFLQPAISVLISCSSSKCCFRNHESTYRICSTLWQSLCCCLLWSQCLTHMLQNKGDRPLKFSKDRLLRKGYISQKKLEHLSSSLQFLQLYNQISPTFKAKKIMVAISQVLRQNFPNNVKEAIPCISSQDATSQFHR